MKLSRELLGAVRKLLQPIEIRLADMVARAVVQRIADGGKLQALQAGVLAGEDVDDVERFGEYGLISVPPEGAEAVLVFPGGDRGHPLAVAVDDRRHRPTDRPAASSGLYTKDGEEILLTPGVAIDLTAALIRLGSSSAADGVIKGTTRDTAEQVFLTALGVWAAAVASAVPALAAATATFATAQTTFAAAATAAVSAKVKTE